MREAVTGAIEIRYRGRLMQWAEIPAPLPKPAAAPAVAGVAAIAMGRRPTPSADHPWRRGYAQIRQGVVELARTTP